MQRDGNGIVMQTHISLRPIRGLHSDPTLVTPSRLLQCREISHPLSHDDQKSARYRSKLTDPSTAAGISGMEMKADRQTVPPGPVLFHATNSGTS